MSFAHWKAGYYFIIAAIITLFTTPVYAEFTINKVRSYLTIQSPVDTFKVTNSDRTKVIDVQAQIMSWTQKNGENTFSPTTVLILAPPIMKIPPGRTQLLRIGWRQPAPTSVEQAFRLYLQEITPLKPLEQTGVQVRLRLDIPVYITPANPIYQLTWQPVGISGANLKMEIKNSGNVHLQVIRITLRAPDGTVVGKHEDAFTLLSGQGTQINIPMTSTATKTVQLIADTDYVPMQAMITLP